MVAESGVLRQRCHLPQVAQQGLEARREQYAGMGVGGLVASVRK